MKIVVVSGGFDPIHSGHIAYFKYARDYGDRLIVALNSDAWLEKKKGRFFMPFEERKVILNSIKYVDEVVSFEDDEKGSCINALEAIKGSYPNDEIYFANGGDRDIKNIPEMSVSDINFIFNIGGNDKKNSSSWILKKWQYYFEERQWGSFFNLFETKNIKVKELIIDSGKSMSFQRHFKRNEIWFVSEGSCTIFYSDDTDNKNIKELQLNKFDYYFVPVGHWHQITNPFSLETRIIEIQYGEECRENDIERLNKD
jgi:cytidyltransferase-like protein